MYLEYLTGTSWSSLILSNISSLRQKQIKILNKTKQKPYWHLFFRPVETAQLPYEELEPRGSRISRLEHTERAFLLVHKQGKPQLLAPTRNAQLPSPTRRHRWLKKVLFLVKHTRLVWSHWKKWTLWCHFPPASPRPCHHSEIKPPQAEPLTLRNRTNYLRACELTTISGLLVAAGT